MRLNTFMQLTLTCCFCVITRQQVFAKDLKQILLEQHDIAISARWHNLLHYDNEKSVINADSNFFLSSEGYKNPQAEYLATINGLFDKEQKDDDSVLCRYPARVHYILQKTQTDIKSIPSQICSAYSEYQQKVPIDKAYIVFAAENNQSPSSMLGHTFLKISGQSGNVTKQHSFSYFAALDNANSLKFYADVMTIGLDGAYILSPYQAKANEYLLGEKRSLWEFELTLSLKEKEILKQHLWELKGKNIRYKFITHNCNTALMSILKVANKNFTMKTIKPFTTPVEYIQELSQNGKISNISIEPTISHKKAIEKFGLNYIGNAPKPARFSTHQDIINNITNINFSPVYQDIRDVSNAYFPDLESKILDLSANYYNKHQKFVVDRIDLLKMMSVIDYPTSDSYSKYFRLGFENDLFSENMELKPVVEFGLGFGKRISSTTFYVLPKIGYHYDDFSNYYIVPQIGILHRMNENIKIINSYEKYFDSKENNKGYDSKYNFYLGYQVSENSELYIDYSHYSQAKHSESLSLGITLHF